MKREFAKEYESLVHDYAKKLVELDRTDLSAETLQKVKIEAGEAGKKLVEYGYAMAHDLDAVQDDLFTKWWFKLFTKLQW